MKFDPKITLVGPRPRKQELPVNLEHHYHPPEAWEVSEKSNERCLRKIEKRQNDPIWAQTPRTKEFF